jgi:hypothetical protein
VLRIERALQHRFATDRIIFSAALALFAAQCWFIKTYGEPYPAIVMPTFVGAGGYSDGEVTFPGYEAVFLADGQEYTFAPTQLLGEFPVSFHRDIAFHALRPLQEAPAKAPRTFATGTPAGRDLSWIRRDTRAPDRWRVCGIPFGLVARSRATNWCRTTLCPLLRSGGTRNVSGSPGRAVHGESAPRQGAC